MEYHQNILHMQVSHANTFTMIVIFTLINPFKHLPSILDKILNVKIQVNVKKFTIKIINNMPLSLFLLFVFILFF